MRSINSRFTFNTGVYFCFFDHVISEIPRPIAENLCQMIENGFFNFKKSKTKSKNMGPSSVKFRGGTKSKIRRD